MLHLCPLVDWNWLFVAALNGLSRQARCGGRHCRRSSVAVWVLLQGEFVTFNFVSSLLCVCVQSQA